MTVSDPEDWQAAAGAWIAAMDAGGDWARQAVIDPALDRHLADLQKGRLLDVGCGEGRACRLSRAAGFDPVGIDPCTPMIEAARERDPGGEYLRGGAEHLPFDDRSFGVVLSCVSLVDIPDAEAAIAEMARVLSPGGTLLVINLTSIMSAGLDLGWEDRGDSEVFRISDYGTIRPQLIRLNEVPVTNWHRPLAYYMTAFLNAGLVLRAFEEPLPQADVGRPDRALKYEQLPWFNLMRWQMPH